MINTIPTIDPLPLVFLGSAAHDHPEHRKRLVHASFAHGLAPVLLPASLAASPRATKLAHGLLDLSAGYLGLFVHRIRAKGAVGDAPGYEEEWRYAASREKAHRLLLADETHPGIEEALREDTPGFLRLLDLKRELGQDGGRAVRFSSGEALGATLPDVLASLRRNLGLAEADGRGLVGPPRTEVFVSYAHDDDQGDQGWLHQVEPTLKGLSMARQVPYWCDKHIGPGERWEKEIFKHVDQARVAVLLVSPKFLASVYIMKKELPRILDNMKAGLQMLPVLVEDCAYTHHPELPERQFCGPKVGHRLTPLARLSAVERDEFFVRLADNIWDAYRAAGPPPVAASEPHGPSPADVLLGLCDGDAGKRKAGLELAAAYFLRDDGRPTPWAWPHLAWARAVLGVLREDAEVGGAAGALFRQLPPPDAVPVTPVVPPAPEADEPDAQRAYLGWTERTHRWLELPGIREIAALPRIELDCVYVALRGDRASAHERLQARRLLDLEVVEFARSLNHEPTEAELPALRRQLLLVDPYMPLQREAVARPGAGRVEHTVTLGEAFRRDRWLVILGDPGSGKTTLIRWLALQLTNALKAGTPTVRVERRKVDPMTPEDTAEVKLGPARLPVLVRVGDYADEKAKRGGHLALHEYLGHHSWQGSRLDAAYLSGERANRLILDRLRAGAAVILLDGMDEIARSEQRDAIRADITAFIEQWVNGRGDPQWVGRQDAYLIDGEPWEVGGNQIVITSRVVGYHVAPLSGPLTHVTIEPMAAPAVRSFCSAWCRAVHDATVSASPVEERARDAAREAAGLQRAIFDPSRPRIRELASNPLLVTILALLYRRNDGRLPDQRVELYRTAIDVLIEDWPDGAINQDELRSVLPDVAELMHRTTSTGLVEPGNLKPVLAAALTRARRLGPEQAIDPGSHEIQEFLDVALRQVGLMAGRGDLLLGFLHLTFQEYLAAVWLVRDQDVDATVARVRERLDDPRWREPVLLALGYAASHQGWPADAFVALLRGLIAADEPVGDVLPRVVLLLAHALEELPRVPDDLVADMTRRLLRVLAERGTEPGFVPLRDEIDTALVRFRRQRQGAFDPVLMGAITEPVLAAAAAALIRRREWFEAPFAEPLQRALLLGLDREAWGWPVHLALRDYATPPLPPALPAVPTRPRQPTEPADLARLHEERDAITSGARLGELQKEIADLVARLPQLLTEQPADDTGPPAPVRRLQALHAEQGRLTSGEALAELDRKIVALTPMAEQARAKYDRDLREHAEAQALYERAGEAAAEALARARPRGQWTPGGLPMRTWLAAGRQDEARRSPEWLPLLIALYGGVKDYRVGLYEGPYQRAVEAFQDFRVTYKNVQDDAIYDRAVALDGWEPAPSRWRIDLPFAFDPEFVYRRSPLHGELTARFDDPTADLRRRLHAIWSGPGRQELRVEALLALFALGEDVEPLLGKAPGDCAAAARAALEGLLAGWRETLEYLLPRQVDTLRDSLTTLAEEDAAALRELLLVAARQVKDANRRARLLWRLLPEVPTPTVPEVWAQALDATWQVAHYWGYDDPPRDCQEVLDQAETPAAEALLQRLNAAGGGQEDFNRLFAEALCPGWIGHPDLVAEALHEHLRRVPPRFDEKFQDRLLQGADSLADVCTAWFFIEGRYPFAVLLDNCGVRIPSEEDEFQQFVNDYLLHLEPGRQARTMLRLDRYLNRGRIEPPVEEARRLAEQVTDPAQRLWTQEMVLQGLPPGPDQAALADESADLLDHVTDPAARVASTLRLLPLASPGRQAAVRARLLADLAALPADARATVIRQARRWATTDVQADALNEAADGLPDGLRRWAAGRLPADVNGPFRQVFATDPDGPVSLAWSLVFLAGRAEDVLAAGGGRQEAGPWSLLGGPREAEAVEALLQAGEKSGLPLTAVAAAAIEYLRDRGREDLLRLLLPLLERPARDAWPRVQAWLRGPLPLLADHAALLTAERGRQVNAQTFPGLLSLLESGLDRSRLRAALVLHGEVTNTGNEVRPFLASLMQEETVGLIGRAMADRSVGGAGETWLEPAPEEGHRRYAHNVLGWLAHSFLHDDPDLYRRQLAAVASSESAATFLRRVEAVNAGVLRVILESLRPDQPPRVQRVLLIALIHLYYARSTSYRLRPGRGDWKTLDAAVQQWLPQMAQTLRREPVVFAGPEAYFGALAAALKEQPDLAHEPEIDELMAQVAEGSYCADLGTWLARQGQAGPEDVLKRLAFSCYLPSGYEDALTKAARALIDHPPLVPAVLRKLATLLHEDVADPQFSMFRSDLIEVLAAYAIQQPAAFAASALPMGLLPLLVRVVAFGRTYTARRGAVTLISFLRRLTPEVTTALLSALRDIPFVQNAAVLAIGRFRYVDPEALQALLAELSPETESATAVYGAASLLAGLAASNSLTPPQRQEIVRRLAGALREPALTRRSVYLMAGSGEKGDEAYRVRHEGRLGAVLYDALLRVAGGALQLRAAPA